MSIQKILIVDDEPLMRDFVCETLIRMGFHTKTAQDGLSALRQVEEEAFDLVFTDMKMPKLSGIDLLKKIKEVSPDTEVVLMTAYGTIESAVDAMKLGAVDYLLKPFTAEQVELLVEKVSNTVNLKAENAYLKNQIDENFGFGEIIGESECLNELFEIIKKTAVSHASVMINGESGTGKELVARALHYNSLRKSRPFIKLNCAALPANLIESELFGHEKGAFTGAVTNRAGRFELANGGTIFLDEISEMDTALQSKLLRVLQEREFERVGSAKTIKVDVRVIASTNRDIIKEIEENRFREDLYYRLNVIPIEMPPLRKRDDDIVLLSEYFLQKFAIENGKDCPKLAEKSKIFLKSYNWPGNVRELQNIMERIIVLEKGPLLEPVDFGIKNDHSADIMSEDSKYYAGQTMQEIEKNYILDTLAMHEQNRTKTAKVLGISIRTLRNKLNEYNLDESSL